MLRRCRRVGLQRTWGWPIMIPRPIGRGLGFVLGVVLSAGCHADGASIAKEGVGAALACQTCHGAAGEGVAQAGFPRLASLGAAYLQRVAGFRLRYCRFSCRTRQAPTSWRDVVAYAR